MKIPAHSPFYLRVVTGGRREAVAISPVVSLVVPAGHRRVDERVDVHAVAVHHGKVLATTSLLVSHFAVLYPCMRLLGELVTPFLNVQRECVYNKTINNGNERDDARKSQQSDTLTYTKKQRNKTEQNPINQTMMRSGLVFFSFSYSTNNNKQKTQTHTKQKQNEKQMKQTIPFPPNY